jgi:hypothetical protein
MPTIIGLGWVGLLNYGCKVYVLYTKIPNIELVILCVLHHTHPKENKALELWEAQDLPKGPIILASLSSGSLFVFA